MEKEIDKSSALAAVNTAFPETVQAKLRRWGLWNRCGRETVTDLVAQEVLSTQSDAVALLQKGLQRLGLATADEKALLQRFPGRSLLEIREIILREECLQIFKETRWSDELPAMFLKYRPALDRIVYSLLRIQNGDFAMELFFQIQEGERSFAEIAREFSLGAEAHTDGLIGPVAANSPHPELAGMLASSQPGQLWPPKRLGEWFILVRLEKRLPAQFDEATSKWLLDRRFEEWTDDLLAEERNP